MLKNRFAVIGFTALSLCLIGSGNVRAQNLANEEITFTISAPFKLRHSTVELPAGKYILKQLGLSDFGLYFENMMHSPVAMVTTIPTYDFIATHNEEGTHILLDRDTVPTGEDPILEGWSVPGGEAWQVVGAVADRKRVEAVNNNTHSAEQRGAQ